MTRPCRLDDTLKRMVRQGWQRQRSGLAVSRVREVEAETWSEIGERLGRLGYWEFEDNRA